MRLRGPGRGRHGRRWLIVALVAAVIAVQLPVLRGPADALREAFVPATRLLTDLGRAVDAPLASWRAGEDLQAENARLRAENARLEADNARLAELERQNAFLLAALGFKQEYAQLTFVTAEVVGFEPSNLARALTINRGHEDGVRPGTVVVAPRGVVGQVTAVTPRSATVLLLTDPRSAVDARAQESGARGVVAGLGRPDLLVMRYVRQEEFLSLGERVSTSGLGGVFPRGLPVGYVGYVQRRDVDALQEAYLEPAVDYTHLAQVLVLRSDAPGPPRGP
ncbi:MAG: rod shape-determining protein MreC [Chloroflexi bacterium]|nr:rod shape-determining protein MreC [Chloroflexota bacterium]